MRRTNWRARSSSAVRTIVRCRSSHEEYRLFVDNYFRYVALARDDAGDINDLVELGGYLTGRTNMGRVQVPDLPYGQALREASARPGRLCALPRSGRAAGAAAADGIWLVVVRRREPGEGVGEQLHRSMGAADRVPGRQSSRSGRQHEDVDAGGVDLGGDWRPVRGIATSRARAGAIQDARVARALWRAQTQSVGCDQSGGWRCAPG